MKPLLTLCMIVKDEAHGIARTLQSAKPWIDRWCILDTGSTDGTPDVIESVMCDGSIVGHVVHVPFVDFATTRNELLRHVTAGFDGDFLLLLDADDVLEGGEALRAFLTEEAAMLEPPEHDPYCDGYACGACHWQPDADREAFYVRMSEQACEWNSARVVRASAIGPDGWHYVGAVHEVLAHPSGRVPSITIPGVSIRHERGLVSAERMRQRWERDVALLRAAIEKDPKDARATFYLARTLRQLGRNEEAIAMFEQRVPLVGFIGEKFEALYEIANLQADEDRFVAGMLAAHEAEPWRAEPLCALAWHFRNRSPEMIRTAALFALRAFDLVRRAEERPPSGLFVDREVYTWRAAYLCSIAAWHVGEFYAGEHATRWALANDPPEPWRRALAENLRMYEERKRPICTDPACLYVGQRHAPGCVVENGERADEERKAAR